MIGKRKACYICGARQPLHLHHIFEGSRRKISDANGFTVYLCAAHHNASSFSAHTDNDLNLWLKREAQKDYEKTHTRDDFIKLIGKNYLEE